MKLLALLAIMVVALMPVRAADGVPEPVVAYQFSAGAAGADGLPTRSFGAGTPGGLDRVALPAIEADLEAGYTEYLFHLLVTPRVEPPAVPMRLDGARDAEERGLAWMVTEAWAFARKVLDRGAERVWIYVGTEDAEMRRLATEDPGGWVDRAWPSFGPGIGDARIGFAFDAWPHLSPSARTFAFTLQALGHPVMAEPYDISGRLPVVMEERFYDTNRLGNKAAREAIDKAPVVYRYLTANSPDAADPGAWLDEVAAAGHVPVIHRHREFRGWTAEQVRARYVEARKRAEAAATAIFRDRDGDGQTTIDEILANLADRRADQMAEEAKR